MKKPNLYLINGPLGAGKTTFLRYLLAQPEFAEARVIENEFASTSIDTQALHDHTAEVQTIAGVCICCSTGDELLEVLAGFTSSAEPVVIEATGVANSLQLIEKLALGDMLDRYHIAQAIFVLDAAEVNKAQLDEYASELQAADTVLLSKLDLISRERAEWLRQELAQRGVMKTEAVAYGEVSLGFLQEASRIVSFAANDDNELRAHNTDVNYTVITLDRPLSPSQLEGAWPRLRDTYELRRLKGDIIDVNGGMWHIEATPAQLRATRGDSVLAQLVCIGGKAREITLSILNKAIDS